MSESKTPTPASEPVTDGRLRADLEQSRWCAKQLKEQRDAYKDEVERLRVEQAAVVTALGRALGTSPATLGQAAGQAVKAIAERDTAREKAAADLEAHSKALMNNGIAKVMGDDVEGFSTVRFASTVSYAAKYLRGEADAS